MAQDPNDQKQDRQVLIVLTNVNSIKDPADPKKELRQTGWYLPEVAHPYYIFTKAGYKVVFASIKGGEAECDFGSYTNTVLKNEPDKDCAAFVELIRASDKAEGKDKAEKEQLAKMAVPSVQGSIGRFESGDAKDRKITKITLKTASFTALQGKESTFDIIFFAGGHGTCYDFYDSNVKHDKPQTKDTRDMHAFAAKIYENKDKPGVVAAVCHGPNALIDLKLSDGTMLVKGKNVTGFTNSEEVAAKLEKVVPILLEDGLKKCGGQFIGKANFTCNAVADKGVVTGQNPQSAAEAAKLCLSELAARRKKK